MKSDQQKESLQYFKAHAKEWTQFTQSTSDAKVNNIKQRNDYAVRIIKKREKTNKVLDVGCGTGELVHELADLGITTVGVDYAEEMIAIAKGVAQKKGLSNTEFFAKSIFEFDMGENNYDAIVANGFIEYISYEELDTFLDQVLKGLTKGGSFIVGSRNRLFNIFSLNDFSKTELEEEGGAEKILREAIAIAEGKTIEELERLQTIGLQKEDPKQNNTGVTVSVRYQFTPAQLLKLLRKKGFTPLHLSPIHIHGVIPAFKNKYPEVHTQIANLLQKFADDNQELIPYASSFMVHAKKI